MNKIVIVGNSGSRKSTLAKKLSNLLNIPVFHLDKIYHQTKWPVSETEKVKIWADKLEPILKHDKWILDGLYLRTIDLQLSNADTVIFLDFKRSLIFYRIFKRRVMYHNKQRPDMPESWKERIEWKFLKFVYRFKKIDRPIIMQKLAQYETNFIFLTFTKPAGLSKYLNSLSSRNA